MEPSDKAVRIAARIADGSAIDWEAAASPDTTPVDRGLIDQLRAISDIATAHRTPSDDHDGSAPPATWNSLTILSSVGKGRFGEVFVAWDPRLHRRVALKLLYATSSSLASPTRAIDEARLLARVRHQNVLTVHGAEYIGDSVGIWTEFIEGRTLEQLLTERGRLDPDEVTAIAADLAQALGAVHDAGLLHRDIKAQNVMRETGGRIVLMDFGAGHDLELSPARDGDYTVRRCTSRRRCWPVARRLKRATFMHSACCCFIFSPARIPRPAGRWKTYERPIVPVMSNSCPMCGPTCPMNSGAPSRKVLLPIRLNDSRRRTTSLPHSLQLLPAAVARARWSRAQLSVVGILALIATVAIVWSFRGVPPTTRTGAAPPVITSTPPPTLPATPPPAPPPVLDTATLRIWKGPGFSADGTASADGRFLSATAGVADVIIRDLQLQATRVIQKSEFTEKVSRYADQSCGNAISRDGSRVAYQQDQR